MTECGRENLASIIAAAAIGFYSIGATDAVFAAQKCTSIQARCAVEIGGRCDPETGRWRYGPRAGGSNIGGAFDSCISRELKAAHSGQNSRSGKTLSIKT